MVKERRRFGFVLATIWALLFAPGRLFPDSIWVPAEVSIREGLEVGSSKKPVLRLHGAVEQEAEKDGFKPVLKAPLALLALERFDALVGVPVGRLARWTGLVGLWTWGLWPRFRRRSILWALLFGLGSPAWVFAWNRTSECASALLVALAAALVWAERGRVKEEPFEQVYQGPLRPGRSPLRWVGSGVALGLALGIDPLLSPLLLPFLLARPAEGRSNATVAFLGGAALPFMVQFFWGPGSWSVQPVWDTDLLFWNAIFLLVGAQTGILVHYPTLLVQAWGLPPDRPRMAIGPAAFMALALLVLLRPFDWSGSGGVDGFPAFLPVLALVVFSLPQRASLALGVVGAALGLGISLRSLPALEKVPTSLSGTSYGVDRLVAWLPETSTLRQLPGSEVRKEGNVFWQMLGPTALEGISDASVAPRLVRLGVLLIWAPEGVQRVRLELGENAPTSVSVEGALLGGTVFRPSGSVGFELYLDRPRRKHRTWWSQHPVSVHRIEVDLGRSRKVPVSVGLSALGSAANEQP